MATHSSVLAWRIPGVAEPGGLPSMGSHRVRHNWCDLAAAAAAPCWHSSQGFLRHLPSMHLLEGREICSGVWSKSWMPATQLKKKDFYSNTVSPHTYEPSSCDLSKMQTCIPMSNHKVSSCVWRTPSCAWILYRLFSLYVLYSTV